MLKTQLRIEIVSSNTPSLSSMSHQSRQALWSVLSTHYSQVAVTLIDNIDDLEALVARQPDLVFLGMKFIPRNEHYGFLDTDKIWLGQYLDENGINYTGSNHLAHNLELDKPLAKQRVQANGLATSAYVVLPRGSHTIEKPALSYPLFVKPTNRGGGLGIDSDSLVHNLDALRLKAGAIARELQSDSLVEQYLPGREFSVAILENIDDEVLVMPIELVTTPDINGARILSDKVKTSNQEVVSMVEDEDIRAKVCQLALNAFHALGARDYGRIDIRLDGSGVPHFLEANLLPSLIEGYGNFPKACTLNSQLSFEAMILTIVGLALARKVVAPEELLVYPAVPALAT